MDAIVSHTIRFQVKKVYCRSGGDSYVGAWGVRSCETVCFAYSSAAAGVRGLALRLNGSLRQVSDCDG